MSKGSLEVICGSMFSGKTEELMRRLKRAEYAKQNVLTLKHHIDNRFSSSCIVSHNGQKREALPMSGSISRLNKIIEIATNDVDIVGIDELHFFSQNFLEVVQTLIDLGKRVVIAGLDLDFRGVPFKIMATALALADYATKLKAICVVCGSDSYHTQRLINGTPAKYDDPIIMVGASECYEARCRNCFVMQRGTTPPPTAEVQPSVSL